MKSSISVEKVSIQIQAGRVVVLPAYIFSFITMVLVWLQENLAWIVLFFIITLLHLRKLPFQYVIFLILHSFLLYILLSIFHHDAAKLSVGPWEGKVSISEKVKWNGDTLTGMGVVISGGDKERIFIKYKSESEKEKQTLGGLLLLGEICVVSGNITTPEPTSNPFVFDFPRFLSTTNTSFILDIDHFNDCDTSGNSLTRSHLLYFVKSVMDDSQWTKYILSLVLGDRSLFSEQEINTFQRTGIIHLLAISGLHVGIIIAAFTYIGFRLGLLREIVYVGMIFFIPLYIYVTGSNPPVIRAGIMGMIVIIFLLSRFQLPSLYVFSIVFAMYLMYFPHSLLQVGFQLSFFITAALLLSLSLMKNVSSVWVLNLIVTSISTLASLFILPLHFYSFATIGWAANLLFVPYFTLVLLPVSFILFILLFIQPTWSLHLAPFTSFFLTIPEYILHILSNVPYSHLNIGKFDFCHWVIFCILTLFILYSWQYKKKFTLLFVCWFLVLTFNFYPLNGYVTMLDVGQGDAFVVREPFSLGATVIDTGGILIFNEEEWRKKDSEFSTGYDIVLPYLKGIGAQHIDQLVLTHGDADHMQGALKLIQFIPVKKIVIGYPSMEDELVQELLAVAKVRGIPIHPVKQGDELVISRRNKLKVLHPSHSSYQSSNDGSIVLVGDIGGLRWLFTGDLEEVGEKELLQTYPYLKTDVLKVSHHGSNTSTKESFLKQLSPKIALISAGRENRYGHPHEEVVNALSSSKIKTYRTDLHGAVTYRYNFWGSGTFWTYYPYHETNTEESYFFP